jgi:hypothetical protein
MVQGPLGLDWGRRKFGVFPRIEQSGLMGNFPPSAERVKLWIDAGVSVKGAPEHVFVKLYTHGTQENVIRMLFDNGGFVMLFRELDKYVKKNGGELKYLSSRELANIVTGLDESLGTKNFHHDVNNQLNIR